MSMGIYYLPQGWAKCTMNCTALNPAKGGELHKEHSLTRPETTGASHTLLVAYPCCAVLSQTANLPALREVQTNASVTARCGGHTEPVLFQDKTTETMRHASGFTNPHVTHVAVSHYARPWAAWGAARSHGASPHTRNALPPPLLYPIAWLKGDSAHLPDGKHPSCSRTWSLSAHRDAHTLMLSGITQWTSHRTLWKKKEEEKAVGNGGAELDWHTQPQLS